jgi:hypothetical protein
MTEIIKNGGFEKQLSPWSEPTPNPKILGPLSKAILILAPPLPLIQQLI